MSFAGFSVAYVLKTGIAAVLFIVLFKWLANRSNVAPLQTIASQV